MNDSHGHIIKGYWRLIKNEKLNKCFAKGLNFIEPQCLNYSKRKKIDWSVD